MRREHSFISRALVKLSWIITFSRMRRERHTLIPLHFQNSDKHFKNSQKLLNWISWVTSTIEVYTWMSKIDQVDSRIQIKSDNLHMSNNAIYIPWDSEGKHCNWNCIDLCYSHSRSLFKCFFNSIINYHIVCNFWKDQLI